jgi:hypothetical protein
MAPDQALTFNEQNRLRRLRRAGLFGVKKGWESEAAGPA